MRGKNLLLIVVLLLTSCSSNSVSLPDFQGVDENTTKTSLTTLQLIPKIEYEYSDKIPVGNVIKTEPKFDSTAKKSTIVRVYVSKGPSIIESVDSSIQWYQVGSVDDDWEFTRPRIEKGFLLIDCDVKFGSKLSWYVPQNDGEGFGRASVNDKFDKTVPVKILSKKMSYSAGVRESFSLKISVADLDNKKPTDLFLELYANVNRSPTVDSSNKDVKINFSISWPSD
jgi:hypothetical protein